MRNLRGVFPTAISVVVVAVMTSGCSPKSKDWGDVDVLRQKAPGPVIPTYHGKEIPYDEYLNWVKWGEEWFRTETFGNERFLTDIVGFLDADVDVSARKVVGGSSLCTGFSLRPSMTSTECRGTSSQEMEGDTQMILSFHSRTEACWI